MLDILNKHLDTTRSSTCVVHAWINTLKPEEQKAFDLVKENHVNVKVSILYKDLSAQIKLPFKISAFRAHVKGYCICPKN